MTHFEKSVSCPGQLPGLPGILAKGTVPFQLTKETEVTESTAGPRSESQRTGAALLPTTSNAKDSFQRTVFCRNGDQSAFNLTPGGKKLTDKLSPWNFRVQMHLVLASGCSDYSLKNECHCNVKA